MSTSSHELSFARFNCSTWHTEKGNEQGEEGRNRKGEEEKEEEEENGKNKGKNRRSREKELKQENSLKRKCKDVIKKARSRQCTDAKII